MSGESAVSAISVNGGPPSEVVSDILRISPGWMDAMRTLFIDHRDFSSVDTSPPAAIVNQAFANNSSTARIQSGSGSRRNARFQVVGLVRDARSKRGIPTDGPRNFCGAYVPRANPMAMASSSAVEFYVSNIRTQMAINWRAPSASGCRRWWRCSSRS